MNFFIATIKSQYEYMLHSPKLAKQINTFFDVALPVSLPDELGEHQGLFFISFANDCRS